MPQGSRVLPGRAMTARKLRGRKGGWRGGVAACLPLVPAHHQVLRRHSLPPRRGSLSGLCGFWCGCLLRRSAAFRAPPGQRLPRRSL
ncbi:unnamed protein product [Miscanthus lutarioriparius]|uniref:Uncharacterized protein n=1 Tax=Miscanthus lutarioriparius TaxID=422564 RepID=A0A811MG41_9POAL|nr:unnamed protein product [Miscanthus lutarioriparius]